MSARNDILRNIRRSLGRDAVSNETRAALEARLAKPVRGIQPARVPEDKASRVALFQDWAETVQAKVTHIDSLNDVPDVVSDYLAAENLPAALRHADHPDLNAIPWSNRPTLSVDTGPSDGSQTVGMSAAFAGIAETGTLALLSGSEGPTTLNFLPATHIVLLRRSDIEGSYEDVWDRLRAAKGPDGEPMLPRTVNMITGPSRTGDIEQTIYLGAHGPLNLHILILDDETG